MTRMQRMPDDMIERVLAMLDKRIEEEETAYRSAGNDEVELYLQGRWEEAQHIAKAIRKLESSQQ